MELPKVLIIDVNAWRDDAGANTLRNIFSCWDPNKLALIYTSSQLPNCNICRNYFQISENKVLKSVFSPSMKVGCRVSNSQSNDSDDAVSERQRYSVAHQKHAKWMRLAREIVWKLGHWKTKALRDFIKSFNPDVIFVPIFPTAYMGRIQKYVISIANKPTVCYLADDNYSYDACKHIRDYLHRFWTRKYVGPLARKCQEMFVIVDKEKEDTDRRFGTNSNILTKGIDFSNLQYNAKKLGNPLKIIYTGNLIIGRDKTLSTIADMVNKINDDAGEIKSELYIYSPTIPDDLIMNRLNSKASHYCGSVPHQGIKGIQEEADIVIFAEALHGKDANIAKLSFSTKITDYLSNSKCILAVGKEDIAPIEYFKKNDSAIIATSEREIEDKLRMLIENPNIIQEYSKKAFECALRNHDKKIMDQRLIKTIVKAVEEKEQLRL